MLTKVQAYSSWHSAPTLALSPAGREETDLLQIRDIQGLDPVKAGISSTPLGSVDGTSIGGASVENRNIVLTIRPNPDWDTWTYESLRRLLYTYFMPKRDVRLVFYSNDLDTVDIYGVVESVAVNQFSKDPELVVSIICPDPYFTSLDPTVVTGKTVPPGGAVTVVNYPGNVETGLNLKVTFAAGQPAPSYIAVQIGNPRLQYFSVVATVSATSYFEMNTVQKNKYINNVGIGTGVFTNLYSKINIREGSLWPNLESGDNQFFVITDVGLHDWTLTYSERFGGL